jgi:hypothetical protein
MKITVFKDIQGVMEDNRFLPTVRIGKVVADTRMPQQKTAEEDYYEE